jgi:5-(carboxyamino)imidazole ribonucleotide mutase
MARTSTKAEKKPIVGIVMGSQSDWETMQNAAKVLSDFGVSFEAGIVSAHRTPDRLVAYGKSAAERGLNVIIAGAGGAAHLPGMLAALTTVPVLGVPVQSRTLDGLDSLLSIAQMPAGIPVGTLAIGNAGATNAGLLAVSILALHDEKLAVKFDKWRKAQTAKIAKKPVTKKKK